MTDREKMQQAMDALKKLNSALAEQRAALDYVLHYHEQGDLIARLKSSIADVRIQTQDALIAGRASLDSIRAALAEPEPEPVAWRNAALRVGEDLCSVGPFGYYDMTAQQWLDWALSVVTCHPPQQRGWQKLTDEEIQTIWDSVLDGAVFTRREVYKAIEAKLKEKNT